MSLSSREALEKWIWIADGAVRKLCENLSQFDALIAAQRARLAAMKGEKKSEFTRDDQSAAGETTAVADDVSESGHSGSGSFRRKEKSKMAETPLQELLNEINSAAKNGFPFLALAMTIALPDICVSLVSADGRSDGPRYKDWCKNNLGAEFSFVTADDLYSMRCGVLHNGRFGDLQHNVARVLFALPGAQARFTNCKMGDAYVYSVERFCENFTAAASTWFEKNKNDAAIQANLPRLMQYHRNGLKPYVDGMPLLA
jgi:hypothetical protein